ncbi:hypothetical protein [Deinococcus sp. QL22]|uniref:hypothetical protein n=1 Tax=Deinococcus sp. QL22 TaxID=2939437 RepID=UPI0020174E27|nr:hypothetical protein [Deinococcus sp. QL22]UQN10679.1 hypothetical protein M1R55_30350 [Deinococcus sp. QL22]
MYRTCRATFPIGQTVELPCYRIEAFNGLGLELIQEPWGMVVNVAAMNAHAIACAREMRPEGWELRGLIAVDAVIFEQALQHAMTATTSRRFGVVLGDDWYLLTAVEEHSPPRAGQVVLVGLYR